MAQPDLPKDPLTLAVDAWLAIRPFLDDPEQPEWLPSVYEIPLVLDLLSRVQPATPEEEATVARIRREAQEAGRRWGLEFLED